MILNIDRIALTDFDGGPSMGPTRSNGFGETRDK